ncbi:helix-turn-helix domain-containing protein [Streptomyces gobiensis]|uniref:helix-turn-helix domain-containing protein n=1 Tax=Streptomyces gobiensis TaxID=2875706 RepID=UPI001E2C38FE|nr:helix-turn-helix transcriptional regulator [Streptomyces gobiensis]UGY95109.1 helix-turn-helix domain-containing protein [Streptomyces gobiensis]
MPPRSTPTTRQERLGVELYRMREAAAMTARDAAKLLGVDPAKISHIEAGRVGVSEERLRRLAAFYSCSDTALIDALSAMTHEQRGQGWWEEYRGILPAPFLDLSELEHHASYLQAIQITDIPGLFQTEDYARAIFGCTVPQLPQAELEARVAHRMERQKILLREEPPTYEAIIHEAVLRMHFGGRKVVRAQLAHLLEQGDRPGITVRVVPFTTEEYMGANRTMLYAGTAVPKLDTVQIETAVGVTFLDAESQLKRYRTLFQTAEIAALGVTESHDFVHAISREL